MHIAITCAVLLWAAILCRYDLKERRLPNGYTLGGAALALVIRAGYGGLPLFIDGFAAAAAAGLFLLIPFLMRGAGGGDVKMLFAAGAIVGWSGLLPMLWVMALAGIVLGIVLIIAGRVDSSRVRHYAQCVFNWRYDRRAGAETIAPKSSEKARMPFSLPIATGLIFAWIGGAW